MKNLNLILITVLLISGLFFSKNSTAQDSQIMAGAGLGYTSDINSFGLSVNGLYLVNDTWEAGARFTYLFENDFVQWNMLDLDGHYVFMNDDTKTLYALAGLNFTFWNYDFETPEYGSLWAPLVETGGTETGLNLGAGGRYALTDQLYLNGELKYTLGNFDFLSIGAGIMYRF